MDYETTNQSYYGPYEIKKDILLLRKDKPEYINAQFFTPWIPRNQTEYEAVFEPNVTDRSCFTFGKLFNIIVFNPANENCNINSLPPNFTLSLYPKYSYKVVDPSTSYPNYKIIDKQYNITDNTSLIRQTIKVVKDMSLPYIKTRNSTGTIILNSIVFEETEEESYPFTVVFPSIADVHEIGERTYILTTQETTETMKSNNTEVSLNKTETESIELNLEWNRTNNNLVKHYIFEINNNGYISKITFTLCIKPKCSYSPFFSVDTDGCMEKSNKYKTIFICDGNKQITLYNLENINANTETIIKVGMFKVQMTFNGNITFNLPDIKYSQCLPLLVFNNCQDQPYCQKGAYTKYFFSFGRQRTVYINKVVPKNVPYSQLSNNITITLYGGFFSPDMRCIINSIETQFIFGSENVVGCLLPSLRANVYNFTGYLRREDCEQTSDYSFNFTVYKSLSITETVDETKWVNSKTIGNLFLKFKVKDNNLYSNFQVQTDDIVIIYNNYDFTIKQDEIYQHILLDFNTITFYPPYLETNGTNITFQISIDAGYTFKEFSLNPNISLPTCPAGYQCNFTMGIFSYYPFLCPPGTYSQEGDKECIPCPSGAMCPSDGMAEPDLCFPGYICDKTGLVFPTKKCEGGYICPQKRTTPLNQSLDDTSEIYKEVSTYLEQDGIYKCYNQYYCEEGTAKFYPTALADSSFGSQKETFYANMYASFPIIIDELTRKGVLFDKFKGKNMTWYYSYSDYNNDTSFLDLYMKTATPIQCIKGYNCEHTKSRIWGDGICQKGHYCPTDKEGVNSMIKSYRPEFTGCDTASCSCPRGFYCPDNGMTEPLPCKEGTFQNNTGQSTCDSCTAGYYCPNQAMIAEELKNCSAGYYCPGGSYRQIECYSGTFQNETRQTFCYTCEDTKECLRSAMTSGEPCSAGYLCNGTGIYNRTLCPAGYYCTGENGNEKNKPENCTPGTQCPEGSSNPEQCEQGTYSADNNTVACLPCPLGYYCPDVGSTNESFVPCSEGYICNSEGLVNPEIKCPAGYVCLNFTFFTVEEIKRYTQDEKYLVYDIEKDTSDYYNNINIDFRNGLLQNNTIIKEQNEKNKTVFSKENFMWPLRCPQGYRCSESTGPMSSTTSVHPIQCGLNTYQNFTGSSSCTECPLGYECVNETNTKPYHCPKGQYRDETVSRCTSCPIGTYLLHSNFSFNYTENNTKIIENLTKLFLPDDSSCKPCPAGYYCPSVGIENDFLNCTGGYFCPEGTSSPNITTRCPNGYYCKEGIGSVDEATKCPYGRVCIEGTDAKDTVKCDLAEQYINNQCYLYEKEPSGCDNINSIEKMTNYIKANCSIGTGCPKNYYCPLGAGKIGSDLGPKECPPSTTSPPDSFTITQCVLKSKDRYAYDEVPITLSVSSLSALSTYKFTYNRLVFEKNNPLFNNIEMKLGNDYDIILRLTIDSDDVENKRIMQTLQKESNEDLENFKQEDIFFVENLSKPPYYTKNYVPYMKIPLLMDLIVDSKYEAFKDTITFSITASFTCKLTVIITTVNPIIYEIAYDNITSNEINGITLFAVNDVIYGENKYKFITQFLYDSRLGITEPSNFNVYPNYVKEETKRSSTIHRLGTGTLLSFSYFQNIPTLTVNQPDSAENILSEGSYPSSSFYSQYLPYISNCDNIGAFVPLWRLISYQDPDNTNNTCTLVNPSNTRPLSMYIPKSSIGDECHLKFTCRYNENLESKSGNLNQPWIYSPSSTLPLFYISKTAINKPQDYFIFGKSDTPSEFVGVTTKTDMTLSNNYYPQDITLKISYYQYSKYSKEIASANLIFENLTEYKSEYEKLGKNEYTFHFEFYPLSWMDCMKNFLFPMLWYIIALFIIMAAYFLIYLLINYFARKTHIHGGQLPKYQPRLSFFQTLSTIIGVVITLLFLVVPVIAAKYSFNNVSIGLLLYDYLSNGTNANRGRIGSALMIIALVGIVWITKFMTPQIDSNDKNINKVMTYEEIQAKIKKGNNQVKVFLFWMVAFSFICAIENLYCYYVLMKLNNYIKINSLLLSIIQMVAVQVVDQINAQLIAILMKSLYDPFYAMPFKIVSAFIIKSIQFQTNDFLSFIMGYLQSSVLSSLVQRLLLQSILPIFQMKWEDHKKKDQNLRLRAESYLSDEAKKEELVFQLLSGNSIQIAGTLSLVVNIGLKYLFFNEIGITDNKDFYFYYIILTVLLTISEIPLDTIVTNIIECWSELKITRRTITFQASYHKKKKLWAIYDNSHLYSYDTKEMSLLEKLGFSWQYYFILSFCCCCVMLLCLGLDLMTINKYNPLSDMLVMVMLPVVIGYFVILYYMLIFIFERTEKYFEKNVSKEEEEEKKKKEYESYNNDMMKNYINGMNKELQNNPYYVQQGNLFFNTMIKEESKFIFINFFS